MITTILRGGMGNQLFQWAFGFAQARRLGVGLQLDVAHMQGRRKFQLDQWSQWCLDGATIVTGSVPTICEEGMPYNQALVDSIKDGDVLHGYWQTEKYFEDVAAELRHALFPFHPNLSDTVFDKNSVAVHVRRGDYLLPPYNDFHGVMPLKYYRDAMHLILAQVPDAKFLVFSDDPDWCKEHFPPDFVIMNPGGEATDIYKMSLCQHAIIANSSFSWWGAWLGDTSSRTVIAPKKWFNNGKEDTRDIVPERWVKL